MKKILSIIFIFLSLVTYGQTKENEEYVNAIGLLENEHYPEAYNILKDLEPRFDKKDTLYGNVLWAYVFSVSKMEELKRVKEQWNEALKYGQELSPLIEKAIELFPEKMNARKYWAYKNRIVTYFGLQDYKKAKEYQNLLYQGYKKSTLPEGIDQYYNFEFFKWEDKNIWGYEWYPELGDPETEGSFSKIVYYVYDTKPDGSDKDQLYRLHVLKFHKLDNDDIGFDYVLTKMTVVGDQELSQTLYTYTYKKDIDYSRLHNDIKEVLKGNTTIIEESRRKK